MNMKLWIIIAISTLLLENKAEEFSISIKSDTEEFVLDVTSIKSTYWNINIPDEADKNKKVPLNYTISKEGVFRTILKNDLKMYDFINFTDVNWEKVKKIKVLKEGAKDILIDRNEDKKVIHLSQKKGELFPEKEEITITWK